MCTCGGEFNINILHGQQVHSVLNYGKFGFLNPGKTENSYFVKFTDVGILPQNALRRDFNGKCIELIEGHYLEVVVEV